MPPRKKFDSSDLSDYIEVRERIVEFRRNHPNGSFQPANPDVPFTIVEAGGQTFVAVTMACYRDPYDTHPGIASAWQVVPGPTNFTRNSELMNAETSAIGRAIIAALAGDASKSMASKDEVRQAQDNNTLVAPDTIAELEGWRATLKSMSIDGDHDTKLKAKGMIGRWKGITRGELDIAKLEASRGERLLLMLQEEWGDTLPEQTNVVDIPARAENDLLNVLDGPVHPSVGYPPGHEPFAPEPVGE